MSSFTAPLRFESTDRFLDGRRIYKTTRDLAYWTMLTGRRLTITVPAGFLTDLASVPAAFRWFVAPDGPWAAAAVAHDWLYRTTFVPRRTADRIFREALGVLGVGWLRRTLMYAAVRVGGRHAYGRSFY